MRVRTAEILASYVQCLNSARDIALGMADELDPSASKMRVDALAKIADQYLGALKLLWPMLPDTEAKALAKEAEAVAAAAFAAESSTPQLTNGNHDQGPP